jgi:hypothetical protein
LDKNVIENKVINIKNIISRQIDDLSNKFEQNYTAITNLQNNINDNSN